MKKIYDVTIYTTILTKEQAKYAVDLFLGHCGVLNDYITIDTQSYKVSVLANKEIDMRGHAISIASYVQTLDPNSFVRVRESRFADIKYGIRWVNDGVTVYSDSSIYEDPEYVFHYNDFDDYEIVYIPTYADRFCPRDKEYYEKSGAKYMWRCTACWDNFMEAETIEEAIEEFEEMYREKLWNSIVSLQDRLREATDKFREFDDYRSRI